MNFSLPGEAEGAQISVLAARDTALPGGRVDKEVCKYGFDYHRTIEKAGPRANVRQNPRPISAFVCHCVV